MAAGQPGEPLHSALREDDGDALARRFLKPLEGSWDDGDENLVRGYLDRWTPVGADPVVAAARALTEAARALASIDVRPKTLWFFLWEMESMLRGLPALPPLRQARGRS